MLCACHGVGPAVDAGIRLGEAIGRAAVERRDSDGSLDIRSFAGSTETRVDGRELQ